MFKPGFVRNVRAIRYPFAKPAYSGLFIRHNSTNVVKETVSSSSIASEVQSKLPSFEDVNSATSHLTSDQFGYLESIGLAQNWWWPTDVIQHALEIVHVSTGMPWWATIIATTIGIRAAMFPIYIRSSDMTARSARAKPEMDTLMAKAKEATDYKSQQLLMVERKKINQKYGIKYRYLAAPLLQLPVALGFFAALRSMSNHPVEGFQTQGIAWFSDLTVADPYLGLQLIAALVFTAFMRLGGETGAQQFSPVMKKVFTVLPFISIPATMNLSAAVVLYFAANAFWSVAQASLLKNKAFREKMGMYEIYKPPVLPNQPTTIKEAFNKMVNDSKEKAAIKMKQAEQKKAALDIAERQKAVRSDDGFARIHRRK